MPDRGGSADDLPLAAYGGTGMDLSEAEAARLEAASAIEPELPAPDVEPHGPTGAGTINRSVVVPATAGDPDGATGRGPSAVGLALAGRAMQLVRTSRIAAGALFVGVILIGLILLSGGTPAPGAASATASPSNPGVALATAEPGEATLVLTGAAAQTLTLAGMTGSGAPSGPLAVSWSDATLNVLALEGMPDRGTRATDAGLVLRITVTIGTKPVTFTSTHAECAIGMAVHAANVSGTFACPKLKSPDGKLTIGASGTYRT
jgi:hypothetical protein